MNTATNTATTIPTHAHGYIEIARQGRIVLTVRPGMIHGPEFATFTMANSYDPSAGVYWGRYTRGAATALLTFADRAYLAHHEALELAAAGILRLSTANAVAADTLEALSVDLLGGSNANA